MQTLFYDFCLVLLLLFINQAGFSQLDTKINHKTIEGTSYDRTFIIAIVDSDHFASPDSLFPFDLLKEHRTTLLLFEGKNTSAQTIYSRLNLRMNNPDRALHKSHLHLLIQGNQNTLEKYEAIDHLYFNTFYFITQDTSSNTDPFHV